MDSVLGVLRAHPAIGPGEHVRQIDEHQAVAGGPLVLWSAIRRRWNARSFCLSEPAVGKGRIDVDPQSPRKEAPGRMLSKPLAIRFPTATAASSPWPNEGHVTLGVRGKGIAPVEFAR